MPKTYSIHSIFHTLQGEGVHAGTPAVFLRFAGCNVWSGRPEDREKHAARGLCALWCDTEFRAERGVGKLTAAEVVIGVEACCNPATPPIVVVTGGEPSLQLDDALVEALHAAGFAVHVETNGSRELPFGVDWVTLSPKPPMHVLVEQPFHEIKCIYPDVDPEDWRRVADQQDADCPIFVQPRDDNQGIHARDKAWREAVAYVLANPRCRLSLQTHKLLGIE